MKISRSFHRFGLRIVHVAIVVCSIVLARVAGAEPPAQPETELHRFSGFLDTHPEIADQLLADPKLADSPDYLTKHPELHEYLANHPGISKSLATHPRFFMHREMGFMRSAAISPGEVRRFDRFLDEHPEVAKELAANPQLARDPQFVAAHPEFHEYLKSHPGITRALEAKPGHMMNREAIHERHEHGK